MSAMRTAACGFERLVTRSLAIVAIAVAAGAAYSWLHGPLDPEARQPEIARTDPTESPDGPEIEPGGNDTGNPSGNAVSNPGGDDGGDPVETDPTPEPGQGETAAALPEGHISLEDAYNYWREGMAVFIDARPKADFEAGHINGALNLSLEMTADADRFSEVRAWLDSELPIILYCRGGLCSEAKDVGRLLKGAGYQNTLILGVGFPGWQEAGYSVKTGPES